MVRQNTIIEGIHYATGKVIRLGVRGGIIYNLADINKVYWSGELSRDHMPVIAPGLVDLQINGFSGIDFNDPELTGEQVELVSLELLRNGVTRYYPTLITGPPERISSSLKTFADVISDNGLAAHMIGGIHLEGPFISKEDGPRGAHPGHYCLDPDLSLVKRWQDEAHGHIRILTLAPELAGSDAVIEAGTEMGMVVAIGHTAGSSADILRAADAGATLSTHLGNGAHAVLPRHPNYIWDQLAENRLYTSMIADGFHLPDSVLRVFIRSKREKAILVSDGMAFTGMEPGVYDSPAAGKVRLAEDGRLHREGHPGLLAGSACKLLDGVKNISRLEGFSYAWDMGSVHPSTLMNRSSGHGLQVGASADLVLLDPDLEDPKIRRIYKNGVLFEP